MAGPFERLHAIFTAAGVRYAVIGAHAVNAWVEPRFTADIDITISASPAEYDRLREKLAEAGFELAVEYGADLASGPDFLRFVAIEDGASVELQSAKTAFQLAIIQRAVLADGAAVATPEDLIVMKLIADRPKDRLDIAQLATIPGLDWDYIAAWAREWQIQDRLRRARDPGA